MEIDMLVSLLTVSMAAGRLRRDDVDGVVMMLWKNAGLAKKWM
jgi:hypothetical protein